MLAPKALLAASVVASGASAAINQWVSVGAGVATIVGAAIALYGLRRRRRLPKPQMDLTGLPTPPPALPVTRVSKDDYAKQLHEWDIYQARLDQFFQDQKGRE